jgi:hypothetical protein
MLCSPQFRNRAVELLATGLASCVWLLGNGHQGSFTGDAASDGFASCETLRRTVDRLVAVCASGVCFGHRVPFWIMR